MTITIPTMMTFAKIFPEATSVIGNLIPLSIWASNRYIYSETEVQVKVLLTLNHVFLNL